MFLWNAGKYHDQGMSNSCGGRRTARAKNKLGMVSYTGKARSHKQVKVLEKSFVAQNLEKMPPGNNLENDENI